MREVRRKRSKTKHDIASLVFLLLLGTEDVDGEDIAIEGRDRRAPIDKWHPHYSHTRQQRAE